MSRSLKYRLIYKFYPVFIQLFYKVTGKHLLYFYCKKTKELVTKSHRISVGCKCTVCRRTFHFYTTILDLLCRPSTIKR